MRQFEFNGEQYKQSSRHQKEWGRKLIAEMCLKGDERVLDLGCGDGVLTAEIAEALPQGAVVGLDASGSMIATAEALVRPNLTFVQRNIEALDYREAFDVIFSNATLHWIADHRKLAWNCCRALKPGGRLHWNFAADGNCATFTRIVREIMALPVYRPFFAAFRWPWYTPAAAGYAENFRGLAFAELKIKEENADRYFVDAPEMIRWLDQPSLIPFLAVLPETQQRPFRDRVVDAMIAACQQPDGRCFETFRRLHLAGTKA